MLNVANCGLFREVPCCLDYNDDDGLWILFTDAEDEQKSFVLYCIENDEEEDIGFGPLSLSLIACALLIFWD